MAGERDYLVFYRTLSGSVQSTDFECAKLKIGDYEILPTRNCLATHSIYDPDTERILTIVTNEFTRFPEIGRSRGN